jgi:hypothetical protein
MTDRPPRSSYESGWLPYTKVTGRIAVRAAIGEALRTRYEVPQHLPNEMLTLLTQVNALQEDNVLRNEPPFKELLPKI